VKRWYYIILLAVLVLGCVYVYLHRYELGLVSPPSSGTDDSASTDQSGSTAHPAHIVWQKVDRSTDGFTVEMPTDVKEIQIPAYNETGGSEQVNMIFATPDAETTYSVAWADDPPVARYSDMSPDKTLDTARDGALARTQTTLVSETKGQPQGFPDREFASRNIGGGVMNSRLIYAGKRLYMLIAAFPSTSARRDEDVNRFFNSLQILNK
jgi:hypothetical protein